MHNHIKTLTWSHGSMIGNRKRDYWYCLISLGCTVLEEPRSIWPPACCICTRAYADQLTLVCVFDCISLKSKRASVTSFFFFFQTLSFLCQFVCASFFSSPSVQLYIVRQTGRAAFGDLSMCTEPASPRLSATCVSLYSLRPVGQGWLICQAVCWPPLRSFHRSGPIPVVKGTTGVSSRSRAVCQLSQYGWRMRYILSVFCLFLLSQFPSPLPPQPSQCLSLSLVSDWRNWHAELGFVSDIVAGSATCQRNLSRHFNTCRDFLDFILSACVCVCARERGFMFFLVRWVVCQSVHIHAHTCRAQILMCMCNWM